MPKNITIYGRVTCAPCSMVKQFLNKKSVQFDYRDLDEDQEAAAEAFAYAGMSIVPVTVVTDENDNRTVVTGFNLQKLIPLLG